MELNNEQLNGYIGEVLAFGPDQKKTYQDQIDFLKKTITNAIHNETSLGVIKITQAGSWAKGTGLRPMEGQALDIDLLVWLEVEEAKRTDLQRLHDIIIRLLRKAYPTKPPGDFEPNPKTVGITFRTSGLEVDLVPVIPVKQPDGYVWQPERGGKGSFQTSPDGQLEFVRAIKGVDATYAPTVRLAKRWRNYAELDGISSFALELILAHLHRTKGALGNINQSFLRFLLYVTQSELRERITFPDAIRSAPASKAPVQIHDPMNNENNVTAWTSETERAAFVKAAGEAVQSIGHAMSVGRKGETVDLWKRVVGPQFFIGESK